MCTTQREKHLSKEIGEGNRAPDGNDERIFEIFTHFSNKDGVIVKEKLNMWVNDPEFENIPRSFTDIDLPNEIGFEQFKMLITKDDDRTFSPVRVIGGAKNQTMDTFSAFISEKSDSNKR